MVDTNVYKSSIHYVDSQTYLARRTDTDKVAIPETVEDNFAWLHKMDPKDREAQLSGKPMIGVRRPWENQHWDSW
jgi:hypothetical protein